MGVGCEQLPELLPGESTIIETTVGMLGLLLPALEVAEEVIMEEDEEELLEQMEDSEFWRDLWPPPVPFLFGCESAIDAGCWLTCACCLWPIFAGALLLACSWLSLLL